MAQESASLSPEMGAKLQKTPGFTEEIIATVRDNATGPPEGGDRGQEDPALGFRACVSLPRLAWRSASVNTLSAAFHDKTDPVRQYVSGHEMIVPAEAEVSFDRLN